MMLYTQGYATLSTTRTSRNKPHGHVHISSTSQSNTPRYTPRCDYLSDRWDYPTFAYTPKEPEKPKLLEPVEPTWNYPVLMETSFLNNVPADVTEPEPIRMPSPPESPMEETKFLYELPVKKCKDFDFLTAPPSKKSKDFDFLTAPPSPTPSRSKYIITPPASPLPVKKYIITPPGSPQQKPKQDDFSFLTLPRKPAKEHSHRLRSSTVSYFHEVKHYIKNIKKFKRKPKLYQLQQEAPKPKRIVCQKYVQNKPPHYGREFHGPISREEADSLLSHGGEGSYLVRESQRALGSFTLGIRLLNNTKNFKLYFDGQHYVAEKRFDSLHDLVADGLITMYVEVKAKDYINEMVAEPIYDKHAKFASIRDRRKSNGTFVAPVANTNKTCAINTGTSEVDGCLLPCKPSPEHAVVTPNYVKEHNFKIHNFKGLNWCEYCGNFMWGLIAQGVRCADCGLATHKQCSKRVPADCTPDKRLIKRIYGVDLTTVVKAHGTVRPIVIDKCIDELEARGLHVEGLYRIPGLQDDIELVRQRFDKDGEQANIGTKDFPDTNAITGALKLYLRQLPIPLVPFEVYDKFTAAAKIQDDNQRLESLHNANNDLYNSRPAHYHTLKRLVEHLHRLTEHKATNKMNTENLSIVFGPTLLRAPNDQSVIDNLYMLQFQKKIVELLIENHEFLFDK